MAARKAAAPTAAAAATAAARLSPFDKLPSLSDGPKHATVLILGSGSVDKESCARALLSHSSLSMSLNIRISSSFPLKPDDTRPRIDYVAVAVDVTNRDSLLFAKNALGELHPSFYLGRSCLLVLHDGQPAHASVSSEDVDRLADFFDIPRYFCNTTLERDYLLAADKILRGVAVACGHHPLVTCCMLKSVEYERVCLTRTE
eukprot:m.50417 g.50417  ORF g.50417 m.50417 type:complete len:202 (+) comp12903_c0_seq2:145-750(+)